MGIVHTCIHKERETRIMSSGKTTGIGIGTVVAMLISWTSYHSIGWVVLHGILGWFYVVYHLLMYGLSRVS
jgi:hypothetical protein